MEKRKVNIRIQGKDYVIVSADAEEYIRQVAFLVEKKAGDVATAAPQLSTAMNAVLVALNLADDYIKSEKSCDNLRQQVADYLEDIKRQNAELEELRLEAAVLKDDIRELEIAKAKHETEISGLRENSQNAPRNY